jgi:hypothetical protein
MNEYKLIWEAYEHSKLGWLDAGGHEHLKRISGGSLLSEEKSLDVYLSDFFKKLEQISQEGTNYEMSNPPDVSEADYDEYLIDHGGFSMGHKGFVEFLKSSIQQYPSLRKFQKYISPSPNVPEMIYLDFLLQDAIISYRSAD